MAKAPKGFKPSAKKGAPPAAKAKPPKKGDLGGEAMAPPFLASKAKGPKPMPRMLKKGGKVTCK